MAINTTTSDDVYEDLCQKIERLEYMPGDKLSENELAAQYGVSRHIIRGALAHLRGRRLVETYPQRGTYVSLIDMEYIADILYMRESVEQEAIRCMLESGDENARAAMVAEMRQVAEAQGNLPDGPDYADTFYQLDHLFHQAMLSAVGHAQVLELIAEPYIHIRRWRNYEVRTAERMSEIVREHKQLVDAIEKGNSEEIRVLLHQHLDTVTRYSKPLKETEAQYFV